MNERVDKAGSDIERLRLQAFRVLLVMGIATFFAITVRGFLMPGLTPWPDMINCLVLILLGVVLSWKPGWRRGLAWMVLASFILNAMDGLMRSNQPLISPTHLLLPLLVLYGATLGNLVMSVTSMVFVLGVYGSTWWVHRETISHLDLIRLSNLGIAAVVSGLASLSVWIYHRRLMGALEYRTRDLEAELERNLRLNAVIFHDINNPLQALLNVVELSRESGRAGGADLEIIDRMTCRIAAIIESVRKMNRNGRMSLSLAPVRMDEVFSELKDIFRHRLLLKEQELVPTEGGELTAATDMQVLCNSVLGNFLSNALKFSPRKAQIEVGAVRDGDEIRIELRDRGVGLPEELLRSELNTESTVSRRGTESEDGSGYGLRIAHDCLQRLGGRLELRNRDGGGTVVRVWIPARPACPA